MKQQIIIGISGLILICLFFIVMSGCGGSSSTINPVIIPTSNPTSIPTSQIPTATPWPVGNLTINTNMPAKWAVMQAFFQNSKSASLDITGSDYNPNQEQVLDGSGNAIFNNVPLNSNIVIQIYNDSSKNTLLASTNTNFIGSATVNLNQNEITPTPTGVIAIPTPTNTVPAGSTPTNTPPPTQTPGGPTATNTPVNTATVTPGGPTLTPTATVTPGGPTAVPPTATPTSTATSVPPTPTNTTAPPTATSTPTSEPPTPNPILITGNLLGTGKIETAASNGLLVQNGKIFIGDGSKAKRFDFSSKNKDAEQTFPDIGTIVQGIATDGTCIYVLVHTGHWYKCNTDLSIQNTYSCPLNGRDILFHNNKIFISSEDDKIVKTYNTDGTFDKNIGSSSVLNKPHGLAFDSNDNLFVTDVNGKKVVKFDSSGSFLENVAITSGIYTKCDILGNHLYISDGLAEIIRIFNINTKTDISPISATNIEDIFIDGNMLYLLDSYNKTIIQYSL